MTDLPGYGDGSNPPDGENHANYSKRAMALDLSDEGDQATLQCEGRTRLPGNSNYSATRRVVFGATVSQHQQQPESPSKGPTMDLRPYCLSSKQLLVATEVLNYQPFIIDDDVQTGVAHSILFSGDPRFRPRLVFRRSEMTELDWDRAVAANAGLSRHV